MTQPFVRYRLNDVLVASKTACDCGRAAMALDAIEGRCDDTLVLPGKAKGTVTVFADLLSRLFARHLPKEADYRLIQTNPTALRLYASIDESSLLRLKDHLSETFERLGIDIKTLVWEMYPSVPPLDTRTKRRRIIRDRYV